MTNPFEKSIFLSRSGKQQDLGMRITEILEKAGYDVVVQEKFGSTSFMSEMHDALASGMRVIALLSDDYLQNANCAAEWQAALTGDPQNKQQRLIVFRVGDCSPTGLLKPIPYVNLVPVLGDPVKLAEMVRNAVRRGAAKTAGAPGTLIDHDVNWQVPSFTGREDALADLRNALFNQTGVAAVTQPAVAYGMGGIGKSALAKEYAWRERDAYSILWWLNAEKEDGIVDGLIRLGAHFIPDLDKEQDRTKAAKAALANVFATLDKPALLVFDNLEDQSLLRKWKPLEHCHVLVTSRIHGWGGDTAKVEITKWPADDARDYLLKQSGRDDLKSEDAAKIAKALDYLPLALAYTAAFLRDSPATTADRYLERIEQHMDRAPTGAEYPKAVFATFQEALAQAEVRAPGAAAILCLAGFCAPDDIPFELFEQKADAYPDDLAPVFENGTKGASLRAAVSDPDIREQALSALASLSLIALKLETRSFSVHRLVQAACRDICGADCESWIATAVGIANEAFPAVEFGIWPLCARLTPHVEAVAVHASDTVESLGRLLNQAGYYLNQRAEYLRAEPLYRRALTIAEKSYGPDHPIAAIHLNNLALLLRYTNRLTEAEPLFRSALAMGEKTLGPEHPQVAIRLNNLAGLLLVTDRQSEAEPLFRRALAIGEKTLGPDHPTVAIRLNNLAELLRATGRIAEAEPLHRRALAIDEKAHGSDHPALGNSLNNLAVWLGETGRLAEAIPMMERAVSIRRATLGDDHPDTQLSMGSLDRMRRDLEESDK